jgi:hypothetical protein
MLIPSEDPDNTPLNKFAQLLQGKLKLNAENQKLEKQKQLDDLQRSMQIAEDEKKRLEEDRRKRDLFKEKKKINLPGGR